MTRWRFFQGLRDEWRWYRLDQDGNVVAESDQGFAELQGCMANAETAGFTGDAFQVYARAPNESVSASTERGETGASGASEPAAGYDKHTA